MGPEVCLEMPPKFCFSARDLVDQERIPGEALDQLKKWCYQEPLPALSDEQLACFLLSCYNDLGAAQRTIHAHFKVKSAAPEVFFNRDLDDPVTSVCQVSVFPVRTDRNDAIVMFRLQDTSYQRFNLERVVKLTLMVAESVLHHDPPDGLIVVIDLKGVGFMHVTKLRAGPLRHFFRFVQEGYSCKIKEIHVLNTVRFIDKIMCLMRPLMTKELYNLIQFHPCNMDMEGFFREHVAKEHFPEDYGGNLADQAVLSAQTYDRLAAMKDFYRDEEEQVREYQILQR